MHKFYTELTLTNTLGEEEEIMSEVSHLLHRSLTNVMKQRSYNPVGISYPDIQKDSLGGKIRVFASDLALMLSLDLQNSLERARDHVTISKITPVPNKHGHAVFSRARPHQFDNSPMDGVPYLNVKVSGRGIWFRLYVSKTVAKRPAFEGYSTYGLSGISTVPDF